MDDSLGYFAQTSPFAANLIKVSRTPYEFENSSDLDACLSVLPLERLYSAAEAREALDESWGMQDYLIQELLKWFKHDFFQWVNSLPCEKCGVGGYVWLVRQ